jgi:hypothetical protein
MHPPLYPPAWANFSIVMECTPESSRCYSVFTLCMEPLIILKKECSMCVTCHDFSTFCSKRRARSKKLLLPNENTYLLE